MALRVHQICSVRIMDNYIRPLPDRSGFKSQAEHQKFIWVCSSNVERHVEAVRVAGSSPVRPTIKLLCGCVGMQTSWSQNPVPKGVGVRLSSAAPRLGIAHDGGRWLINILHLTLQILV